jgi:hypothetical protein
MGTEVIPKLSFEQFRQLPSATFTGKAAPIPIRPTPDSAGLRRGLLVE